MPNTLVLDSFPLISYFLGQAAGPRVVELLDEAAAGVTRLAISTVNLGEVLYKVEREEDQFAAAQALQLVRLGPIEIHPADEALALAAARIKVDLRMAYLDCFVVALAQLLDAEVVTGDTDFQRAEGTVGVRWLER